MATIDKNKFQFCKHDDFASEVIGAQRILIWKSVIRQFLKRTTIINSIILIGILLMSFVYPMFSNFDYNDVSKGKWLFSTFESTKWEALFGTDNNGKSSLMEFGLVSNSIIISFIATVINVVVGSSSVEFGGSQNLSTVSWWKFITLFQTFPFMLIVIM